MTEYPISDTAMAKIQNSFTFHPVRGDQAERYEKIRFGAMQLAVGIMSMTPSSPEQTLAIRDLESAVMRANQAIALNE